MEYFVGSDVSKETLDIACVDAQGRSVSAVPARVANTLEGVQSLLPALARPSQTVVLYEATGVYGKKLSWVLPEHVGLVCEMNPKIVKNAKLPMSQTKTDPVDARRIAGIARHLYLSEPQYLPALQSTRPAIRDWRYGSANTTVCTRPSPVCDSKSMPSSNYLSQRRSRSSNA
jgi:transposase